jgi:ketosteroid isomerase-like protein
MSPEQMLGRTVDNRSDMFSLGSVAYELLCYQQAFKGSMNDGLLQRLPHEDPPALGTIRNDLPQQLEQIVARALQKSPEDRYPDLEPMRDAILKVKRDLGQDDVRTIVVRPRGRTAPDLTAPARNDTAPKQDTGWFDAYAEVADASRPAWAAALPTRVVRTVPQPTDIPPPTPMPVARPSTTMTTPRSSTTKAAPPRPSTTVTTHTRLAAPPMPLPPSEPPSVGQGVLVGSILGVCLIAVLSALSWTSTPPPTAMEREKPAIDSTLERFRAAYRTRDMEAMAVVFPSMPPQTERAMRRTFDTCLVYEVTYDGIRDTMDPNDDTLATADIRSSHTCTPKSGGREMTTDEHDVLSLRKDGQRWVVERTIPAPNAASARTRSRGTR